MFAAGGISLFSLVVIQPTGSSNRSIHWKKKRKVLTDRKSLPVILSNFKISKHEKEQAVRLRLHIIIRLLMWQVRRWGRGSPVVNDFAPSRLVVYTC